ncbi:MAG: hypothetical protein KME18_21375 [Phormidium tanganyikae FI6-MK23]|jgi:hypothetical protein|nr:hypothetical protein [Phormidium tanganyikae FI6-MK23]
MHINNKSQGDPQFTEHFFHSAEDLKNTLKGRYCEVKYYETLQPEGKKKAFWVPNWDKVGGSSETATDEEWIAFSISNIPNADLFINFKTQEQIHQWMGFKDCAISISNCFLAEYGTSNDPHLQKLEAGEIDRFSYEYAWAEAEIYKALWGVLKATNGRIFRALSYKDSYPFNSDRELLVEIVREVLEGELFACFARRSIYNASQIHERAKLTRKQIKEKLDSCDEKKLYRLIDQHVSFSEVFNNTLFLARQMEEDPLIKLYLDKYDDSLDKLNKLQIQSNCDPKLSGHKVPSHTWESGTYTEGILKWNA